MKYFNSFLDNLIFNKLKRGFFVIDKKSGKTSHDEVFYLKKILSKYFNKNFKVGHSGTLDSKVTGILVCGIGRATKTLEYILLSEKKYIAEFLFHKKIEKKKLEETLKKFRGEINQLPPVKSAVKRVTRKRKIYKLEILNFSKDGRYARIFCSVESGTYIRKLAHDIGLEMKVLTSMGNLERIKAGVFSKKNSRVISTENLEKLFFDFGSCQDCWIKRIFYFFYLKYFIYNIEELFFRLNKKNKIKKIFVNNKSIRYIKSGNSIRIKNLSFYFKKKFKTKEIVSIFYINFWGQQKILAVGEFLEDFDLSKKNKNFKKFLEKEIIKLKKVF